MWSGINVIGHQCDRASMWLGINVIGHQCDRASMWSRKFNIFLYLFQNVYTIAKLSRHSSIHGVKTMSRLCAIYRRWRQDQRLGMLFIATLLVPLTDKLLNILGITRGSTYINQCYYKHILECSRNNAMIHSHQTICLKNIFLEY